MEAIRKDGSALQFASVEHKADRVIVLAAVRKTGPRYGSSRTRLRQTAGSSRRPLSRPGSRWNMPQ